FPTITDWDEDGFRWFGEPLVSGFALPRGPPWRNRDVHEAQAFRLLDRWHRRTVRRVSARAYARELGAALRTERDALADREGIGEVRTLVAWLLERAPRGGQLPTQADELEVVQSHGDFQPGNVLVEQGGQVMLTDWEQSATRSRTYDAFVYLLRLRFPRGLA